MLQERSALSTGLTTDNAFANRAKKPAYGDLAREGLNFMRV